MANLLASTTMDALKSGDPAAQHELSSMAPRSPTCLRRQKDVDRITLYGCSIPDDVLLCLLLHDCAKDLRLLMKKGLLANIAVACRRFSKSHRGSVKFGMEVADPVVLLKTVLVRIDCGRLGGTITDTMVRTAFDDGIAYHELLCKADQSCRIALSSEMYEVGNGDNALSETYAAAERALWSRRFNEHNQTSDSAEGAKSRTNTVFSDLVFSMKPEALCEWRKGECAQCHRRCHLYCPSCVRWVEPTPIGAVSLPFDISVVAKPKEWKSKCTAVHACVVAPDQCKWVPFPACMQTISQLDKQSTLILYPTEDAIDPEDDSAIHILENLRHLVVVDSTCRGAAKMMKHEALGGFRSVKLKWRHTTFWKFTQHGPTFMATIEAIYYFLVDYFAAMNGKNEYDGRFDDLLLLYTSQLIRVEQATAKEKTLPIAWRNE